MTKHEELQAATKKIAESISTQMKEFHERFGMHIVAIDIASHSRGGIVDYSAVTDVRFSDRVNIAAGK